MIKRPSTAEAGRLRAAYAKIVDRYPPQNRAILEGETDRMVEQASWLGGARRVLDIGGGYGPFAALIAELGAEVWILDSLDHPYFAERPDLRVAVESFGVTITERDAVSGEPLPFADGDLDAVVSFESIEHWHHSPRALFVEVTRVLRPGGLFVLSAPNAVNLRKRLTVPLGRSNWSHFEDWYHEPRFFGHVREPTVADLDRIAADMGLGRWKIVGRNWLGLRLTGWHGAVARALDRPLRLRPSLCANLYLIGERGH